eukprot:gene8680-11731_t
MQSSEYVTSYTCRICLDDGVRKDLIAPCKCSGSQKWVHRACLDKWRSMKEDKAFSACTECLGPYKLVCPQEDQETTSHKYWRKMRFICYVTRDFLLALMTTQVVIASFAYIAYLCDGKDHSLETKLHMNHYQLIFYYLFGLLLALAFVGIMYLCLMYCNCADDVSPVGCYCCDGPLYGSYGINHPVCICCPQTECCAATTSPECACCAGVQMGEEALIFLFAGLVILAVVGIFVCIIWGVIFIQHVVQKHVHILQKWSLAKDFIVADLSDDKTDEELGSVNDLNEDKISPDTSDSSIELSLIRDDAVSRPQGSVSTFTVTNRRGNYQKLNENNHNNINSTNYSSSSLTQSQQALLERHGLL